MKIRAGVLEATGALAVALSFAIVLHPSSVRAARAAIAAGARAAKGAVSRASAPKAPTPIDPPFGTYWHDGKAELDGYRYTVTRYGRERRGRAVAVYVTEPFSRSMRVKVDDPSKNPRDVVDVLKLNLIRDFQTGVYDYSTMTSLFSKSEDFEPVKVSFVSTEWCGNVYEELLVSPGLVSQKLSSYFEGESATREERRPSGGILEEELFVRLRGLNGPYLAAGESRAAPLLLSSFRRRLGHEPFQWTDVRIERTPRAQAITVPAGRFQSFVYTVEAGEGPKGTFFIEAAYPHRVLRWQWTEARQKEASGGAGPDWHRAQRAEGNDSGELTGTARLKYWQLHNEGDERSLARLGLTPRR